MSYTPAQQLMYEEGRRAALDLQSRSPGLEGTALYREKEHLPWFSRAAASQNMLSRPRGFVCRSSAGRVVRLLQPYDSAVFPQEPEALSAQWGFLWSRDPEQALPFLSLSTSPYMTGDCCLFEDQVYRCTQDHTVWSPGDYPGSWTPIIQEGSETL